MAAQVDHVAVFNQREAQLTGRLVEDKNGRHMGVADQAAGRVEVGEVVHGRRQVEDVLPDGVARAGVGQGEGRRHMQRWQGFQVLAVVGRQHPSRPVDHHACFGIELLSVKLAQHGPVVIAGQGQRLQRPQPLDALVGLRPIADQIAQKPDAVILPVGVGQYGLEGDEISVDVGEEEGRHG